MVVNTELVQPLPQSWAEFWDEKYKDKLGLQALYTGRLLDITAATFFNGQKTLATKEGILEVIEKVGQIKPNTKIWFKAENVMQNALQNEEVIAGMYYHDVASLMAADGFPIVSLFPKEGNVVDYGSWCLSSVSDKSEEAHEFVNFTSDPEIQSLLSRKIGVAPLVSKSKTNLSDEEFAAVSSEQAPIIPAYESYLNYGDFIKEAWDKMLTG